MNRSKIFPVLKYAATGFWWLVLLLGMILVISFISAHFRGEVPRIGNYSVMNIISPSMEPTIESGSYILIKRVDPKQIERDQIICFYSTDPQICGRPNTHRVVEEPFVLDGKLYFTTKGDHNSLPDSVPAEGERLIGVWVKNLPVLTRVLQFLTQNFIWLVAILLLLGVALTFGSLFLNMKKEIAKADTDREKNQP